MPRRAASQLMVTASTGMPTASKSRISELTGAAASSPSAAAPTASASGPDGRAPKGSLLSLAFLLTSNNHSGIGKLPSAKPQPLPRPDAYSSLQIMSKPRDLVPDHPGLPHRPNVTRRPARRGQVTGGCAAGCGAFFAPFEPFFDPVIARPSTPVECYLRLMFLKFRYRLGYESLFAEVSDSIT